MLLWVVAVNIALYALTKVYYTMRNKSRERRWNSMSDDERLGYLRTTRDAGNKRLDFRFAS